MKQDKISWFDELKYKLFNIFPYPDTPFVKTEGGSVYWIDFIDKKPAQICIGKSGHHCGLIKLYWKNDTLEIWDIIMTPKYRGNGLGTQLLLWLISCARQENMQYLWGMVATDPEDYFDRTMAWYLRYGFERASPLSNQIRMKL